jgi:uncharacterized protein
MFSFVAAAFLVLASAAAPPTASCAFDQPALCEQLCAQGDATSCYFRARHLNSGIFVPKDQERARGMYKELCEAGHADSCNAYGISHLSPTDGSWVSDESFIAGEPFFARGCALGSAKACNKMASFLRRGSLGRTSESVGFFARSCGLARAGSLIGCEEAVESYSSGAWSVPVDRERAAVLAAKGCTLGSQKLCALATSFGKPSFITPAQEADLQLSQCKQEGDLRACYFLAHGMRRGYARGKDPYAARKLYELVCQGDQNQHEACDDLGHMYLHGELGEPDLLKAASYLELGCGQSDNGVATSCRALGDLLAVGQVVPRDTKRAIAFYERACRLSAPMGCHQAGALKAMSGGEDAREMAERLFMRACASNDKESCETLKRAGTPVGDMGKVDKDETMRQLEHKCFARGDGTTCDTLGKWRERRNELEEARKAFEMACSAGHPSSCHSLTALVASGRGGPQDKDRAVVLLARACALGDEVACKKVKRIIDDDRRRFSEAASQSAHQVLADGCKSGVKAACIDE